MSEPATSNHAPFDVLRISFEVEWRDYVRVTRILLRRGVVNLALVLAAAVVVASALSQLLFGPHDGFWLWTAAGMAVVVLFVLVVRALVMQRVKASMRRRPALFPSGPREMTFGPQGFCERIGDARSAVRWSTIDAITVTRPYVILRVYPNRGIPVKTDAFDSPDDLAEFVDTIRRWHHEAREADTLSPLPDQAPEGVVLNPDALHLYYRNRIADYVAFIKYTQWDRRPHKWLLPVLGSVIVALSLCGAAMLVLVGEGPGEAVPFAGFAAFGLIAVTFPAWGGLLTTIAAYRRVRRRPSAYPISDKELHLGPDGVFALTERGEVSLPWAQVSHVVAHRERTFLMLGDHSAFVLPDQVFGGADEAREFRERVEEWKERAALRRELTEPVHRPDGTNPFEAPEK